MSLTARALLASASTTRAGPSALPLPSGMHQAGGRPLQLRRAGTGDFVIDQDLPPPDFIEPAVMERYVPSRLAAWGAGAATP